MTSLAVGLAFIIFGLYGLINWFNEFMFFIKGVGPFSILIGGIVSFIAGISSLRARRFKNEKKH